MGVWLKDAGRGAQRDCQNCQNWESPELKAKLLPRICTDNADRERSTTEGGGASSKFRRHPVSSVIVCNQNVRTRNQIRYCVSMIFRSPISKSMLKTYWGSHVRSQVAQTALVLIIIIGTVFGTVALRELPRLLPRLLQCRHLLRGRVRHHEPSHADILRGAYGRIAPTTICFRITWIFASIRTRSTSAARTRFASGC